MKIKQYEEDGKLYHGCGGDDIIWTPDIAEEVFADKWDYGHAFAYLWRRFGPPLEGCDSYKELVGYILTTGMKGVLLYISPKPHASTSFGYFATKQITWKLRTEWAYVLWRERKGDKVKTPRADRIKRAIKQAMEELKRPTNVRDWLINIQGLVDDCAPNKVEPSEYAGYGIAKEYFDKFKEAKDK